MKLIIFLVIVFILGRFLVRGLFDSAWRKKAQEKFDSIKKERIFWRLINGYDGMVFNLYWVFTIYLDPRHLATFLTSFSYREKSEVEEDAEIKKLISQKKGIENINTIRNAIEKREGIITQSFEKDEELFTKADIEKVFDARKDEMLVTEQYDKFVEYYFRLLPSREPLKDEHKKIWQELEDKDAITPKGTLERVIAGKYNKADIWDTRKKLEEKVGDLEWKTEEEKVDLETIFSLKKAQMEIGEVVSNLLCEDISDTTKKEALKNALKEWEQLHMLSWCIIDFEVSWHGTNKIQQWMWKIVEGVFL